MVQQKPLAALVDDGCMGLSPDPRVEAAIKHRRVGYVSAVCGAQAVQWTVQFDGEGEESSFWCVLAAGPTGKLEAAKRAELLVEMSFLVDDALVVFETRVLDVTRRGLMGRRICFSYPVATRQINRRSTKRQPVSEGLELLVEVKGWGRSTARIWDLSEKGACLLCPGNHIPTLQKGQHLDMSIFWGSRQINVVGKVCNGTKLAEQTGRVGVSLTPVDIDAAEWLAELVEELADVRRARDIRRALGGRTANLVA